MAGLDRDGGFKIATTTPPPPSPSKPYHPWPLWAGGIACTLQPRSLLICFLTPLEWMVPSFDMTAHGLTLLPLAC